MKSVTSNGSIRGGTLAATLALGLFALSACDSNPVLAPDVPEGDLEVTLAVERRAEGSDTWREIELERSGSSFTGSYVFASSGEYELRVVGQRHGESEPQVMYEAPDHLPVARAHA